MNGTEEWTSVPLLGSGSFEILEKNGAVEKSRFMIDRCKFRQ